jgi:O-antigen biosynthesis protein
MIYQRLAALFARYRAAHLVATGRPTPLLGEHGQALGHIDRITLRGQRVVIEGWADGEQITLSHAGKRREVATNLARQDVALAYPALTTANPGFAADLPHGEGPVVLTLIRGARQMIYLLPLPDNRAIHRASLRLIPRFLRDLAISTPSILHWLATKDPADRARLKRYLRLVTPSPSRAMQPLLFLADSLASMPAKQRAAELARLHPAALSHRAITIILPIYNALALLPEVLDRLIKHTDLPWRLILIDDASPDPDLRPFLRRWVTGQKAEYPDRITLIENDENQGFIRSVNAGLKQALAHGDHVVLLNSDAFLPQAWATRLMRPFLAHDNVATVTPLSNDAEVFSAPVICQRSPLTPGEADAIDAVAAGIHPDAGLADAPTGVGFCMAMSIDYLRRIPQLDTAFGRGYGEEVDWCQKARALGGRHLGLSNLFVEHRGGTSFGTAEKQRLIANNGAVISRRYPAYDADVQRFISEDPLAASRLALAVAWAAGQASGPLPLYLAHNMGGGAEDYLAQRIASNLPKAALVLRVGTAFRWQLELHSALGITRGGTDDFALIQRLLDPVKSLRIIYSCGVGDQNPADLPAKLLALCRGADDQIDVLIHDYLPISPSYTLLNSAGRYVGLPDPTTEDTAHCAQQPTGGPVSLVAWQAAWGDLVSAANDITVFSQSSAQLMIAAYPAARQKLRVIPHQALVAISQLCGTTRGKSPVIGVLGNIGYQKGAGVLQEISQILARTGAAKLVVLGWVDPMYPLGPPAHIHGGYQRQDIPALATRYGITDWLIPSIWPETFSYTTQEAIATGLPVWGFDLGAQADAIRRHGRGGVIPIPGGVPDLDAFLAALLSPQTESAAA